MGITYKDVKEFSAKDLEQLFLSVEWESGKYPDKLKTAMHNSHAVYSAWDGDKLIGLINSMSDGAINAYFQYLLVNPEYQGLGIGRILLTLMLDKYKTYLRKTLLAYSQAADFYKKCGFVVGEGIMPMSVSSMS